MRPLWPIFGLMIGSAFNHPFTGLIFGVMATFMFKGGPGDPWSGDVPEPWK